MSFVICYRNKILLSSALETHEIVRFIWFAIALTNAVNRVGNEDILVFLLRFPGSREGNGLNVSVFWRPYYAQFSSASRILYPRERNVWALCIRWKFLLGIRVTSKEHFGYFWRTSGLVGLMTAISYDSVTEFWSDEKWYVFSTYLFSSLFSIVSFLFLYLDMS